MANKTTGLFLGKFAPLHKGHQLVIETALREVDNLIVMVYDCPETTKIPLSVRSNWIRKLYPSVEIIEAWDGPTEVGYTKRIKKENEDYVLGILGKRKITHFYSSEPYGEHMSVALNAKNRQVDLRRGAVPISGTEIRKNPFKNKTNLEPLVYRDLVSNIVILGAPSSGKTTLTKELARKFKTSWMPEYGREYWDKNQVNRRLTLKQLAEIAKGHLEREDKALLESDNYLFTDTNAITTYLFSLYYHGKADPELKRIAETCVSRYDLVFVCDIDIPYDDTWDRSGEVNREVFHKQTIAYLKEHKIPFILLNGSLKERISHVERVLKRFNKYDNFLGESVK